MIGQITPLVQVAGRRTWFIATLGHGIGMVMSAAILGFVLGTLGLALGVNSPSPMVTLLGGGVLVLCALRDVGVGRLRAPTLQRQTPRWFRDVFGPFWGSLAWGLDLGQGWTSHILFTGYYGLVAWAVLLGNPLEGALLLGAYGLGRVVPVLLAGALAPRVDPSAFLASPVRRQAILQYSCATAFASVGGVFIDYNRLIKATTQRSDQSTVFE
jgi:cytochrome c biogenesis protein CcdA